MSLPSCLPITPVALWKLPMETPGPSSQVPSQGQELVRQVLHFPLKHPTVPRAFKTPGNTVATKRPISLMMVLIAQSSEMEIMALTSVLLQYFSMEDLSL